MTDLATRPCACGQVMEEVIRADVPNQNGIRTGWYCPACRDYIEAVGRERIVQPLEERQ